MFMIAIVALLAAPANALPRPDEAAMVELLKIKDAYERAFALDKPELILPYLDEDFAGKMLFKDIRGKKGFKEFWDKVSDRFGAREDSHGYEAKLKPEKIDVDGDRARAEGSTEETLHTPLGKITFNTAWTADLRRKDGGWKLTQMDSHLDPRSTLSRFISSFVSAAWLKDASIAPAKAAVGTAKDYRHRFRRVSAKDPDFDGGRR